MEALTAGAYVICDGIYPFQIGFQPHNGNYPVVRLGGHIEGKETGWECAAREVWEEANIQIQAIQPQKTYLACAADPTLAIREIHWAHSYHCDVPPLLVVAYDIETKPRLSLMYLAQSSDAPAPSSEVNGLLLLDRQSIKRICNETITLEQYLKQGGKAVLREQFAPDRTLEPFIQLRILEKLKEADFMHPSS